MAEYKVNAKKLEPGRYELSYGRGKKKLTATLVREDQSNGVWFFPQNRTISSFTQMKQAKAAWGEWADSQYNGTARDVPVAKTPPPPPAVPRKMPPPAQVVRDGERHFAAKNAKNSGLVPPPPPVSKSQVKRQAAQRQYTDREMLEEVQAWHDRYSERIRKVDQTLIAKNDTPAYSPFYYLRTMIDEHLSRTAEHAESVASFEKARDFGTAANRAQYAELIGAGAGHPSD